MNWQPTPTGVLANPTGPRLAPLPWPADLRRAPGALGLPVPFPLPGLWAIDLSGPWEAEALDWLDVDERARVDRQAQPSGRRRLALARAALRRLLAETLGLPPQAAAGFRLGYGPQGKPHGPLGIDRPPAFNLSHSEDAALVLIDPFDTGRPPAEWGVDLEVVRAVEDREAVACSVFTPAERDALAAHTSATGRADEAFLALWTRKEACLKAIGSGFALEPNRFEVGLADGPQWVELPWPDDGARQRVLCLPLEPLAWPWPVAGSTLRCVAAAARVEGP